VIFPDLLEQQLDTRGCTTREWLLASGPCRATGRAPRSRPRPPPLVEQSQFIART
jgi:hypothetical protein